MRPSFTLHDGREVRIEPSKVVSITEIVLLDEDEKPLAGGPWSRVLVEAVGPEGRSEMYDVRGAVAATDEKLDVWERAAK